MKASYLCALSILCFAASLVGSPGEAWAEEGAVAVDELLANGWHRYSEELDFEGAVTAYLGVTEHPAANQNQRLEAYEYLAACRFALGDTEGARQALTELLRLNSDQQLNDPSHSPDLLQLLEDLRGEVNSEVVYPETIDVEPPPGLTTATPVEPEVGDGDERPRPRRPWYRTWWFWTITGVVVVGAITAGAVAGTRGGTEEPPQGSLDPGVVQLPCFNGSR